VTLEGHRVVDADQGGHDALYLSVTLAEPPTLGLPCLNSRISRFTLMTDSQHQCKGQKDRVDKLIVSLQRGP
jgi:hypothetical protein